jgi:hypothetical protein
LIKIGSKWIKIDKWNNQFNLGLNTSEDYDWSKADKENTLHYDTNANCTFEKQMDKNWEITNLNLGLNTSEDYDWSKADRENTLHYDTKSKVCEQNIDTSILKPIVLLRRK